MRWSGGAGATGRRSDAGARSGRGAWRAACGASTHVESAIANLIEPIAGNASAKKAYRSWKTTAPPNPEVAETKEPKKAHSPRDAIARSDVSASIAPRAGAQVSYHSHRFEHSLLLLVQYEYQT